MTPDRLVVVPELSYDELNAALGELGWAFESGPSYPPLVAGEPELATWRRGDDNLLYACNPVAWLRVLDLSDVSHPSDRLALALRLPLLDSARIARLLRTRDTESVLLGVLAADVLGMREHLPAVRALMHHREGVVAATAQRATQRLARDGRVIIELDQEGAPHD
jgi:hypothetical protein